MKVRVLREHDNAHGDSFVKKVGRTYEHPDPDADIAAGLVEDASKPRKAAGARKPASKRPRAPRKPPPAPTPPPPPLPPPEA